MDRCPCRIWRTGAPQTGALLKSLGATIGLLQQPPRAFMQGGTGSLDEAVIAQLIEERAQAKKSRDFARADQIRKDLADQGVLLQDSPQGTTWVKA